ncbi:MFS transporter [Streptomonospora nanhaiensis]|uniref:MFS transporter n=1 Tax=Streptomonospora nanhaiensis TaxID=1323731 RepID=UPI001C390D50|nr:MFS transporter [Streptomonospora nanhaiensis]MBV2363073.1 MFS transporter [Streptomonospora nanhaiensis]MBX9388911.1 MFS transporter [Streptomonospora nanhaiensis]
MNSTGDVVSETAPPTAAAAAPPAPARAEAVRALAVACLGTLLIMMCYPMPMLNLAELAGDLGAGPSATTWLISAISLGLGVALLPAGSLADNRGRKAVFTGGMALVAAGTLAAGLAAGAGVFIAGRVVQGVGGAAVLATALAIVAHASPTPRERVRGAAAWGAAMSCGLALGPLVVGVNDLLGPWRAAYVVIALAAAVVAVLGAVWLTESRAARPRPLDVPGAVLAMVATGALMALLSLRGASWSSALPVVLGVASVAGAVLFVVAERRSPDPLLPLEAFRRPPFLASVSAAGITGFASVGLLSYTPAVLQGVLGMGVLETALYFLAWSGTSAAVAVATPRLLGGVAPARQVAVSLVMCAVGQGLLVLLAPGASPLWVLPGLVVAGIGTGLGGPNLGRLAVETAPEGRSALGSGVSNTARYLGSTAGLPLTIVVVGLGGAGPVGMAAGLHYAVLGSAVLAVAGAALVAGLAGRRAAAV